jgi:hypothetical protein
MIILTPPRSRLLEALRKKFRSPKECIRALGLDERLLAFDEAPRGFSKSRAVAWLRSKGCSEADCDEFLEYLNRIGEGGDRDSRDRHHATSEQHNAMELAAGGHGNVLDLDEMPSYRGNGMPRPAVEHAMDSASPRTAACRIAPGLANIRLGPIGWC